MTALPWKLVPLTFMSALIVSLAWTLAADAIHDNRHSYALKRLQEIVGEQALTEITSGVYQIGAPDSPTGYLFRHTTQEGYNGQIVMWIGVDREGTLLGVRVSEHRETPGLGDLIDVAVSNWILSFEDRSLENTTWALRQAGGDFDKFTGATITPRAVVNAVHAALEAYPKNHTRWERPSARSGTEPQE